MNPDPSRRQVPKERNLAFACGRGFGVRTPSGREGPLAADVPCVLPGDGATVAFRRVGLNEAAGARPAPALRAAAGPDGWVSSDRHGRGHDRLPASNHAAVHLRDRAEVPDHGALCGRQDRLSAASEERMATAPCRTEKAPGEAHDRMTSQTVPCRQAVAAVDGTWKLNQNKPDAARRAVAKTTTSPLAALARETVA